MTFKMIRTALVTLLLLHAPTLRLMVRAQQPASAVSKPATPPPAAAKPPALPLELQRDFYKAQAEMQQAQVAAQQASQLAEQRQQAFQQVVKRVGVACGEDKFIPQLSKQGDLECVPVPFKPEPAKPAAVPQPQSKKETK